MRATARRGLAGLGAGGWAEQTVAASETTTSTSMTDLATSGPAATVVVPPSGVVKVTVSGRQSNSTAGAQTFMGFAISGATTQAATNTLARRHDSAAANAVGDGSKTIIVSGLTPGTTTFTAKYAVSAGTGTFTGRSIIVETM